MNKEAIEMRYLLGKLSDAEAARLEESCFADDRVFDEIETAEDELVDAYVRGSLSSEDRKRFETKLSNSERLAERVEFAKLFSKSVSSKLVDHETEKTNWWDRLFGFLLIQNPAIRGAVAAGIFLVVLGIPSVFVWLQQRNESRRLSTELAAIEQQKQQLAQQLADQQSKTNQLAAEVQNSKAEEDRLQRQLQAAKEQLTSNEQRTPAASILLFPFFSRDSSERDVLNVPSTAPTIQFKLALDDDDYTSYRATIESADNRDVSTKSGLKPRRSGQARIIIFELQSRLLSSGEYLVTVSALTPAGTYEPVADYRVHVSKK